jgi:pimeloyl-ACP methyl ester carboxylesterase
MSTLIHPQTVIIDGLSIRFAQGGTGPQHALLLNPWPESLFAFKQSWPRLAGAAHLVAVDLPGFGGSERREALMNPKAMGNFIVRIADAFGLEKPHMVRVPRDRQSAASAAAYC